MATDMKNAAPLVQTFHTLVDLLFQDIQIPGKSFVGQRCTVRQEMTSTLRNFNRLMNRLSERLPLTGEQEQVVSVLNSRPDKAEYQAVAKTGPFKKKEQSIKL